MFRKIIQEERRERFSLREKSIKGLAAVESKI